MSYGTLKCDNIVFTNGGSDQTITVSGLIASTSGNLTVTGTVQGGTIIGTSTISGATITGNTGQFTTLTGGTAGFTTVTGTTVTGTTANFASGVFTTQISGATVTGNVGSFATITGGVVTLTSGVFAAGSASAPSISFSSDSNTGIYSPGADQVAISTGGSGRLFVDASGRVGVASSASFSTFSYASGDRTPRFQVVGTSLDEAALAITRTNSAPSIFLGNGSSGSNTDASATLGRFVFAGFQTDKHYSGAEIQALAAGTPSQTSMPASLIFNTTPAASTTPVERLRITSSGLVGVGTSAPVAKFQINVQDGFRFDVGANAYSYMQFGSAGAGEGSAEIGFERTSGKIFLKNTIGGSLTTFLTGDGSGRVGIGTTSASALLHVEGGGENAIIGSSSRKLYFRADGSGISLGTGAAQAGTGFYFNEASNFIYAQTNTSERFRCDSSGRLLVGTPSTSASLSILAQGRSGSATEQAVIRLCRGSSPGTEDVLGAIGFGDPGHASNYNAASLILSARDSGTWTAGTSQPSRLVFSTTPDSGSSPVERLRITSTGQVRLAGAGITFNGDTATANELDDYEEGTCLASTGNWSDASSAYVKIGRFVHINIRGSVVTASQTISLPFTIGTTSDAAYGAYSADGSTTTMTGIVGGTNCTTTTITLPVGFKKGHMSYMTA